MTDFFTGQSHKTTLPISGDRPLTVEIRDFEARGATVRFERWSADLLASFKSSFPAAKWSQHYKTWGVPGKTGYKRALKWLVGIKGATPGSFPVVLPAKRRPPREMFPKAPVKTPPAELDPEFNDPLPF